MDAELNIRTKLDELLPELTEKQQDFLNKRILYPNDEQALDAADVSRQSLWRWQQKDIAFMKAYTIASLVIPKPEVFLQVSSADKNSLIITQLDVLTSILPEVIRQLIKIAMATTENIRPADQLRAIEKICELTGMGAEAKMPIGKQSQIFIQMLTLMGPQIASEVEKRGLPVNASLREVVDAQFTHIEEEEE